MRKGVIYRNKTKKVKERKWLAWLIIFLALACAVAYFIFFASVFKIRNIDITVEGERILAEQADEAVREFSNKKFLKIFPQDNYFIFSSARAEIFLKNKFSEIKEININKNIPHSLAIEIKEMQGVMLYCQNGKCYDIDDEGIIFKEEQEVCGGLGVCVRDNSGREAKIMTKALEIETIDFLLKTQEILRAKINLNLVYFEINIYPTIEVQALTSENWRIVFDTSRDSTAQIEALRLVLEEKIKDQRDRLEYVDLRVENRVFYKMR